MVQFRTLQLALSVGGLIPLSAFAYFTALPPYVIIPALLLALTGYATAFSVDPAILNRRTAGQPAFLAQVKKQVEGARRTVLYDGNLGLYQRWYLEMRLDEERLRCERYGLSFAVIVIRLGTTELAGLAEDTWQVVASQAALKTAQSVRTVDLTAALGPHELAVCLLHCDAAGAEIARQRLEHNLEGYAPDTGLVTFPAEDLNPKSLIDLARSRASGTPPRRTAVA